MNDEASMVVSHMKLSAPDIWASKGKWYEESRKSEDIWENQMSDEERKALVAIVRRSIERSHDTVEDWLPEALLQEGGEYIEVRFGILITDIDREIDEAETVTSFQLRETHQDIKKTIDGIKHHGGK